MANTHARDVYVVGNIASGKSTLAALLGKRVPDSVGVREPHRENPFLADYLLDPARWGFTCQLRYFWEYVRVYDEVTAQGTYSYHFIDAGTWTNRMVYGAYMGGENTITKAEHAFYEAMCDELLKAHAHPKPHAFIFLNVSPKVCWRRMYKRGWAYQTNAIPQSYVEGLQRYIEAMKGKVRAPVLEIDSEAVNFTQPDGETAVVEQVLAFLGAHERTHP